MLLGELKKQAEQSKKAQGDKKKTSFDAITAEIELASTILLSFVSSTVDSAGLSWQMQETV